MLIGLVVLVMLGAALPPIVLYSGKRPAAKMRRFRVGNWIDLRYRHALGGIGTGARAVGKLSGKGIGKAAAAGGRWGWRHGRSGTAWLARRPAERHVKAMTGDSIPRWKTRLARFGDWAGKGLPTKPAEGEPVPDQSIRDRLGQLREKHRKSSTDKDWDWVDEARPGSGRHRAEDRRPPTTAGGVTFQRDSTGAPSITTTGGASMSNTTPEFAGVINALGRLAQIEPGDIEEWRRWQQGWAHMAGAFAGALNTYAETLGSLRDPATNKPAPVDPRIRQGLLTGAERVAEAVQPILESIGRAQQLYDAQIRAAEERARNRSTPPSTWFDPAA